MGRCKKLWNICIYYFQYLREIFVSKNQKPSNTNMYKSLTN